MTLVRLRKATNLAVGNDISMLTVLIISRKYKCNLFSKAAGVFVCCFTVGRETTD